MWRVPRSSARALRLPALRGSRRGLSTAPGMDGETKQMNMFTAINDAMRIALQSNPHAVVFGEDVGFGGVFRCTQGLLEEFGPDRVLNMPINEQGLVGFGIGMSAVGGTAIAEVPGPHGMARSPAAAPAHRHLCHLIARRSSSRTTSSRRWTRSATRLPSSGIAQEASSTWVG